MKEELYDILQKSIKAKQEEVIKERLKELGINEDIHEKHGRFTKFIAERNFTKDFSIEETLYYNDGSKNGLRVITFITKPDDRDGFNAKLETTYF